MSKLILIASGHRKTGAEPVLQRAIASLSGVDRYVHNDVLAEIRRTHRPSAEMAVSAIVELWFSDADAALHAVSQLRHSGTPLQALQVLSVGEHVIFDHDAGTAAVTKRMSLLQRRTDMSPAQFQHYWRSVHAPLAECHRFVSRYVQNHVNQHGEALGPPSFDGVAEFLITDLVRIEEDYASAAGQRMKDDVANFASTVTTFLVEPRG
ncbi:MAG: EthD domain-containing protein [Pseudomonadota bacterium]